MWQLFFHLNPPNERKKGYIGEVKTAPKGVQWFISVDPLAEKYAGWSPYNYVLNNPIRFIDPDGRMAVDAVESPDDWVRTSSGKIIHDTKVTNRATAQERYGANAMYLGKSAVYSNGTGGQVSLNENGTITESSFLSTVEVTATQGGSEAWNKADNVATATGLGLDINDAVIDGAIALSGSQPEKYSGGLKTIGAATQKIGVAGGVIGIGKSRNDFVNNKKTGNGIKLGYDIGVTALGALGRLNPYRAIAAGIFDISGQKDNTAKMINQGVENIQYGQWLKSQEINIGQ